MDEETRSSDNFHRALAGNNGNIQWNYLWPGDQTPGDHQALIEQARRDPPALVVLVNEKEMRDYAPLIVEHIHNYYQLAADSGDLAVYLPPNAR